MARGGRNPRLGWHAYEQLPSGIAARRTREAARKCILHTEFVFRLTAYSAADVEARIATASQMPPTEPRFLTMNGRVIGDPLPSGFVRDVSTSALGSGQLIWEAAREAMSSWIPFDLGWVSVRNTVAPIRLGQLVAVEARTIGLRTLNLSRIVDVADEPVRFGFVYATTPLHVEEGEERFLIEMDTASGHVHYSLEAVSRPRNPLARLGYPVTRMYQHRFARDSHRRMRSLLAGQGRSPRA
jgi:uncharacterized protein (UPF0548 family)